MRAWRGVLAVVLTTLGLCLALGAGAVELKQDRDFRLINPPLATDSSKIEVIEFFWYGCPHCFDFEPVLTAWVKKLPADVSFRRVPAIRPNNKWTPDARLYYTLEAMDLQEKLHTDVFTAIHLGRQRLDDEKVMFEWVARKGIDPTKFRETWSSFGVQSRVQQARELSQSSGLTGVPAVVVQGRYQAITQGSYAELIAVVDALVARVRAEGGKR
ncbi:MAG: thiol:disulfide interchange protein DsbA/DsbL [Sulfuritalea sp.]|nr:thiol:disulfide interchange protein DsbA/DsbL [Sulfuritalea sp.]